MPRVAVLDVDYHHGNGAFAALRPAHARAVWTGCLTRREGGRLTRAHVQARARRSMPTRQSCTSRCTARPTTPVASLPASLLPLPTSPPRTDPALSPHPGRKNRLHRRRIGRGSARSRGHQRQRAAAARDGRRRVRRGARAGGRPSEGLGTRGPRRVVRLSRSSLLRPHTSALPLPLRTSPSPPSRT